MKKRDGRSNKISHYPFKWQAWVGAEDNQYLDSQKGLDMASKIRSVIEKARQFDKIQKP
jgi:hypothetical protein